MICRKAFIVLPFSTQKWLPDLLPIVDIDGLDHANPGVRRRTADKITEIAMENGFLYLRNHGVSRELLNAVYEQARYFFARDLNDKNRYYIGYSQNHRGYVPVTEKGGYADENGERHYEAFDMGVDLPADDPEFRADIPLLGPNWWPDQPGFRYILTQYFDQVRRVGKSMCQAFEHGLGIPEGFFRQHMNKPISQMRLLHYIANSQSSSDGEAGNGVNMGAHTDYECFTILHSKSQALQIYDKNCKWVDAPLIENTFYFNIGDMLEAWTGGLLVSTGHRVINLGIERYSIPYFSATDYGTVVEPIHCSRFADRQKAYPPLVAGDHLVSQLLRDFPYLRRRHEAGLLPLPEIHAGPNPFENWIGQCQQLSGN